MRGKVALVTGGGRGIGRAIAVALAREGVRVAICGRTREKLDEVVRSIEAIGTAAGAFVCDISDRDQIRRLAEDVRDRFGEVAILVNNAGVAGSWKSLELPDADWDRILRINLTAPWLCTKAVLPGMLAAHWGRVINIASQAGKFGLRYSIPYSASKHGVLGLTRSLAIEYAGSGVTFNAICPGWVDTEMVDRAVATVAAKTGRSYTEARQMLVSTGFGERILPPEEVAAVAVYLAGDTAGGINGQALDVPGELPAL